MHIVHAERSSKPMQQNQEFPSATDSQRGEEAEEEAEVKAAGISDEDREDDRDGVAPGESDAMQQDYNSQDGGANSDNLYMRGFQSLS